jgi:hypothetical protein
LEQQIEATYGEIDDCGTVTRDDQPGVWVLDTDEGSTGIGSTGIHVCAGPCSSDIPDTLSDWTFYQPCTVVGTDERISGVNDDGTLSFVGGAGELAFDTTTGTFSPEIQHG